MQTKNRLLVNARKRRASMQENQDIGPTSVLALIGRMLFGIFGFLVSHIGQLLSAASIQ